ncbi:MAG: hypothetical protein U1E10_09790 [Bdellovibrionales bacterium]|jgi:hypothetical protein|nr:hypothetical protein [Bdellovibrionales bacterium]
MKVSSAPFEAPIGPSARGTASEVSPRAASDKASLHLVSAPSANSNVKAGLDAATKDALQRLANLAREKENEKEKEKRKPAGRSASAKSKVIAGSDSLAIEAVKEFEPAALAAQSTPSSQNALDRVRLKFEAARKQVGKQVYREAVKRQAMVELEKDFNLDFNVEDLESLSDAALTESKSGFSVLKRVA